MSEIVNEGLAYCGLICKTCPIYLATRVEDAQEQKKMRIEIARLCREEYGLNYDLKDITDCDGCRTENDRLFDACKNCKIRICARERGYENCAYCSEYVCITLKEFYDKDPSAKTNLDGIRDSMT
jgi:predicted nucleic acid binding AN1-type Zn finger protein